MSKGDEIIRTTLPQASGLRKGFPMYEGLLKYFPRALAEVAHVSKIGNDKHNPGQALHHARGKSSDHADCIMRHLVDMSENYGQGVGRDEQGVPQVAYIAWRALALAQEWFEYNDGAPRAPGAWIEDQSDVSGSLACLPPGLTLKPGAIVPKKIFDAFERVDAWTAHEAGMPCPLCQQFVSQQCRHQYHKDQS